MEPVVKTVDTKKYNLIHRRCGTHIRRQCVSKFTCPKCYINVRITDCEWVLSDNE